MAQAPGSPRLFPETPAGPPGGVYVANIDGASRGNPGPASYALILKDPFGKVVFQLGKKLGRQTNNVAEYYGLLAALDYAVGHSVRALRIRSDSELLVRQIKGQYKVKSADLKPLHERALKLVRQLEYFVIEHVLREMNREADALANQALDGGDTQSAGARQSNSDEPGSHATPLKGRPSHPQAMSQDSSADLPIRARVMNGTLVPSRPLNLPEGSEVLITVRNALK